MKYDVFISYSHSSDGRLAPAIQSGLQRLARPWYRRRSLRVFRDETGLTVNPHLWASITEAMDQSRYFVLLASPDAAASPWVDREISHWLETQPAETLLPVLTDGTLVWSESRGDFDPAMSSALSPALATVFAEEPRHLDLRWAHDETQLDLRNSGFRGQVAALAAPIHGIPREELEGEDVRLHRRAMRLAWTAAVALVALLACALVATAAVMERRDDGGPPRGRVEPPAQDARVRAVTWARGCVARGGLHRDGDRIAVRLEGDRPTDQRGACEAELGLDRAMERVDHLDTRIEPDRKESTGTEGQGADGSAGDGAHPCEAFPGGAVPDLDEATSVRSGNELTIW